jgi:hypothetical protein
VNVASVRTHVPVTLNLKTSNFTKWRMLICVLLGKYDLLDHVNTVTAVAARNPDWICEDYIVRSWLYGSITDEILDIIMAEDQTTQEAWSLITNLFLDNQMTRAVYLEAEFRAVVQGNLSITASRPSPMPSVTSAPPSPTRPSSSTASAVSTRATPTSPPLS